MADHVHASMCAFMDAHVDRRCVRFLGKTVHLDLYFFLCEPMKEVKSGKVTDEASALGLPLSASPSALEG